MAFLHCDTPGNNLKVFKGLGNYKKVSDAGVMECAVNKYRSLYKNNHTLEQTKKILSKNDFKIYKIDHIPGNMGNEVNVFYKRKNTFIINFN